MAKSATKRSKLKGGIEPADLIATTPEFRLVFPALFEPKGTPQDPDKLRYSATMLFEKDIDFKQPGTSNSNSIHKIILNAKIGLWGKDKEDWPRDDNGKLCIDSPIKDGDLKAAKWGEAFEGNWYLKAQSTFKPEILDNVYVTDKKTGKKKLVSITEAADIYGGCYCRAVIKASAYDMGEGSQGVTLYLQKIQKLREGENLDGGSDAEEYFDVDDAEERSEEIEDETPKKKKKRDADEDDDDEEDVKPKKKKKKPVEDDEEDEDDFRSSKKKKKKKPVDDEEDD
jgi:hypothetical protein